MKTNRILMLAAGCALLGGAVMAEDVIQDFEGFGSTPALMQAVSHIKAGSEVELEFDTGMDEGNSMNLALSTAKDTWYTQVEFDVTPVSLFDVDSVVIYLKLLPDSSNENLDIQLKDKHGSTIAKGKKIGTQSISRDSFMAYTIDTSNVKNELARISFNVACADGGTANLAVDNISIIRK